jgi:voltage-gated potassium channel
VATLAYELEHTSQPDKFGSIASGLYWAIVTLTTVGYGDITPLTSAGRVLSGVTMVLGILTMALPAGIIASGFIQDLRRIDTAAAWMVLAGSAPFAHLRVAEIALIAGQLSPQRVPAGTLITRAGEMAHSLFVITTGEVELRLGDHIRILGKGEVLDADAVLGPMRRPATARALTVSDLLVLDAGRFQALVRDSPPLASAFGQAPRAPASPPA